MNDPDIIKEKLPSEPVLLKGETVEFKARPAFSFFHWIVVIILTFVPPFFWGIGLFFMFRYRKKHSAVWITSRRLIDFEKKPFSNMYRITSIPLSKISNIRKGRFSGGFSDFLIDLGNRIFGVSDVSIYIHGHSRPQYGLSDIKGAGALITYVNSVISKSP
jgi:hypothetical protein